jgi:hypothetical protein
MPRPPSLAIALALTAGALRAGAAPAGATPRPQPPPKSAAQQEADRHFKSGVARYKEGKFIEALAEFERANEISPHPLVLYNIAGCYRELSRYSEAVTFYTRFLAEGIGKVPPGRLSDAQAELEAIYALIARVTVRADPERGTTLLVDDRQVGELPIEMPLILPPGEHRLLARAPGRADAGASVRVASGDQRLVELRLPALAPSERPAPRPPERTAAARPDPAGAEVGAAGVPGRRATGRFAVCAGFGTNALRADVTGAPSLGLGVAVGSRLELGVDATLIAYSVMPRARVRIAGDAISLHALAALPISLTDEGEAETFVAGAVGLGLRLRLPALPALALRLESYASFAGGGHGAAIPTFLGGELWF